MPRKGENIYKRRDGRWEGRLLVGHKPGGNAVYRSVYAKSYAEVKAALDKLKRERQPNPLVNCRLTVKNLLDAWLHSRSPDLKPSSRARYADLIRLHIEPELGNCRLSGLTPEQLEDFLRQQRLHGRADGKGGLSAKTVSDILAVLKSALKYAGRTYALPPGLLDVTLPSHKPKRVQTFGVWETDRMTKILSRQPDITSVCLLLCLNSGLRLGELCALRWSDFNCLEQILSVRRTVQRMHGELVVQTPKTAASERQIPIPKEILQLLWPYRKHAEADAYILTGRTDKPLEPRTMQYRFAALLKKNDLPVRNFHVLRHSFATRCVEQGMDAKTLSEILGHSNVRTTLQLYVHPGMEQKRAGIEAACTLNLLPKRA